MKYLSNQPPCTLIQIDTNLPQREQQVAISIELSIDNIYLAMYSRIFPSDSSCHIRKAISNNVAIISGIISKHQLFTEQPILTKLHQLSKEILQSQVPIIRSIPSESSVLSYVQHLPGDQPVGQLAAYCKLVLAMAGQFDTKLPSVIPVFRIAPGGFYSKEILHGKHAFEMSFDRNYSLMPDTIWYNYFSALRFTVEQPFLVFCEICSNIYIDVIPSTTSGIGLTKFSFIQSVGNSVTRAFITESRAELFDHRIINSTIKSSSSDTFWLDDNIQTPAIEAVESDPKTEDGDPQAKDDPPKDPETSEVSDKEPKDEEPSDTEPTGEADDTSDAPTTPDNPPSGGDDTPIESRPMVFGLELKLAKNETLDDYLYKLFIANSIDNVLELNHDELLPQTLTLLRSWKNGYLFLAASEETKKFLKQLKIKF